MTGAVWWHPTRDGLDCAQSIQPHDNAADMYQFGRRRRRPMRSSIRLLCRSAKIEPESGQSKTISVTLTNVSDASQTYRGGAAVTVGRAPRGRLGIAASVTLALVNPRPESDVKADKAARAGITGAASP